MWKISAKDSFFDDDAYIVYNSSGGYVDRQRYADMPIDPSIYTQWMTALLIIKNTRHFDKQLNIGLNDLDTAFYYGFEIQEQVCVKDALFALLFCNSGEMANALARHMTGDREEFVRLMNQKASSLGMENTTFTNVTGDVAVKQKTTLRDLTVLMDEVVNDPVFQDIVSEDRYVFSSNQKQYLLENKNWVMMEQDSKVRCCILPIKDKTFSVFASTQIKEADFLTIGYGDSKQNCIEMATNLYEEMRSTYHKLVPLEKIASSLMDRWVSF